jgi:hypothetical protein
MRSWPELAHEWHPDHVFRHDPNAIECFLLLTFLTCNLFHAFFALNLKPAARNDKGQVLSGRLMTAEFSSTPKSNRTLAHRSSQTLSCGIAGASCSVCCSVAPC